MKRTGLKRTRTKTMWSALLLAGCLLGATHQSRASAILTSRTEVSPGSQLLSAPESNDAIPFVTTVPYNGGNDFAAFAGSPVPIDFNNNNFSPVFGAVQNAGDPTHFAEGDPIFVSSDRGIIAFFGSNDVSEVGTQFQVGAQFETQTGQFDATISTFDEMNILIDSYTQTVNFSDDPAPFLGLRNTAGEPFIRYALFSVANTLPADDPAFVDTVSNGFGINQVSINTTAAVPEPSTYAMFGLGVLALVALSRKRRADSLA